jgi:hypothetical protein
MRVSMKHNIIRCSLIVLLIGSVALAAGQAYSRENEKHIQLLSFPFGIASGQTVRTSTGLNATFQDGSVRFLRESIQLLDTEGEVIAESHEIRVAPGEIRFWDVSRDQIRAEGDPGTGRIQVRARILVTTSSFDVNRNRTPLLATLEVIDSGTGRTVSYNPYITIDNVEGLD